MNDIFLRGSRPEWSAAVRLASLRIRVCHPMASGRTD